MLVLACDTSTDFVTLAVGAPGEEPFHSLSFKHHRDLSRRLYSSIDEVLAKAGKKFRDIEVLAVGVGPGSFTGVRVAVTTMKTLAQAGGKLLVAVGTLHTYAAGIENNLAMRLAVVLPSRRGEVYFQEFNGSQPVGVPTVLGFGELMAFLDHPAQQGILLCGQTSVLSEQFDRYEKVAQFAPPAEALIKLALTMVTNGEFADPLALVPVYAAMPAISQHKTQLLRP